MGEMGKGEASVVGEEGWAAASLAGEEKEREAGLLGEEDGPGGLEGDDGEGQEIGVEGDVQVKRPGALDGEGVPTGKQGGAEGDVGDVFISGEDEAIKEATGEPSAEGENWAELIGAQGARWSSAANGLFLFWKREQGELEVAAASGTAVPIIASGGTVFVGGTDFGALARDAFFVGEVAPDFISEAMRGGGFLLVGFEHGTVWRPEHRWAVSWMLSLSRAVF